MTRSLALAALILSSVACTTGCGKKPADANTAPSSAVASVSRASGEPTGKPGTSAGKPGTQLVSPLPCATRDLTLKPAGPRGDLNGMSHSGTYLVLSNRSRSACSIPPAPELTFLDANGPVKTVADGVTRDTGSGQQPIVLQPKQSMTTAARWVSGPVFSDNLCYKLTGVTLALRQGTAMTALTGQMCGERGKGVHFDLQPYGTAAR